MKSVYLLLLTLNSALCFPFFEYDDDVLVASGELTDKEVTALKQNGLGRPANVAHVKRDSAEGSGEEHSNLAEPVTAESTIQKPHTAEEQRALEEFKDGGECEEYELCYSDNDCHGGKCLGAYVGTCNCNACLDFWLCESDAACGGLKGACNRTTRTCDCLAGLKAAGFPYYVDALHGLCNQKSCTDKNHNERCFGLPCHFGKLYGAAVLEGSGSPAVVEGADDCFPTKMCYSDEDCIKGKCVGLFVGKCNCIGCIDLVRCDEDSMCGGVKGACDLHLDMCNCTAAYQAAGLKSFADALVHICDVNSCTKENAEEECSGYHAPQACVLVINMRTIKRKRQSRSLIRCKGFQ